VFMIMQGPVSMIRQGAVFMIRQGAVFMIRQGAVFMISQGPVFMIRQGTVFMINTTYVYLHMRDILSFGGQDCGYPTFDPARNSLDTAGSYGNADIDTGNP